jgi:CheY-like chemotaxis protein
MNKKVLLAEDEELNQIFVKEILEMSGYECDVVDNGAKALEKLKQNTYRFVLLDVRMPVMDGIEAYRRIRIDDLIQPKPILIAVTANSQEEDIEFYKKLGFDFIITKPFSIKSINEVLKKFEEE